MVCRISKRRAVLHSQNPHCYYCGIKTKYSPIHTDNPSEDMATVEHLIDRFHPLRGKIDGKLVLSCFKCNQERSIDRSLEYYIDLCRSYGCG